MGQPPSSQGQSAGNCNWRYWCIDVHQSADTRWQQLLSDKLNISSNIILSMLGWGLSFWHIAVYKHTGLFGKADIQGTQNYIYNVISVTLYFVPEIHRSTLFSAWPCNQTWTHLRQSGQLSQRQQSRSFTMAMWHNLCTACRLPVAPCTEFLDPVMSKDIKYGMPDNNSRCSTDGQGPSRRAFNWARDGITSIAELRDSWRGSRKQKSSSLVNNVKAARHAGDGTLLLARDASNLSCVKQFIFSCQLAGVVWGWGTSSTLMCFSVVRLSQIVHSSHIGCLSDKAGNQASNVVTPSSWVNSVRERERSLLHPCL